MDATKPKTWQWFDLPFYDDQNDFQFDAIEGEGDENEIDSNFMTLWSEQMA